MIRGHAYSITAVRLVQLSTGRVEGKIPLIRVRNPWGNEAEWNGPWSDKYDEIFALKIFEFINFQIT